MTTDPAIDLSIVLSSHNGGRTISRMLDSLCRLDVDGIAWELIVIDNASNDDTYAQAMAFAKRLPLMLVQHGERGKNKALNAYVGQARGRLILFTDDDVIFEQGAAKAALAAADSQPDFDIFGGAILPHWEHRPEEWLLRSVPLGVTYALTEPGLRDGPIDPGLVWGPIMAVRRSVFTKGLRFNEAVGPSAGQYIMGSETEFNLRAARAGHRAYHVAAAKVQHIIRPEQIEPAWVLRRAERFGKNMYWQHWAEDGLPEATLFGVPRWRLRQFARNRLQSIFWRLLGSQQRSFKHAWEVEFLRGYIRQARQLRNQARGG